MTRRRKARHKISIKKKVKKKEYNKKKMYNPNVFTARDYMRNKIFTFQPNG